MREMGMITIERRGEFIKAAFKVIIENGGQLQVKKILSLVEEKMEFTDYELERFKKSGQIRWQTNLQWYSVDCVSAGWLRKKNGVWYITPEGEEAMKLSPKEFMTTASKAYRKAYKKAKAEKEQKEAAETSDANTTEESADRSRITAFENAVEQATDEIREFIAKMDGYTFQDAVGALLRAMGYHTPFIAPRGKDGGIDVIAYSDPFGTSTPRIKVQVKCKAQKTNVQEVRQLKGLLQNEGDAGIFVSTGGFTPDALRAIRDSSIHIEAIDLDRFIELWQEYYEKIAEVDKALLQLRKIYFLSPE